MGDEHGLIGRFVAGAGGLAVAVSVFLTWYSLSLSDIFRAASGDLAAQFPGGVGSPVGDLTVTWSGWHAVQTIRVVLLLAGLAVLFSSLVPRTPGRSGAAICVMAAGLLSTVLAGYRIQSPPASLDISTGLFQLPSPPGTESALSSLLHVHAGPWVALLGGVVVMVGGWLQVAAGRAVTAPPLRAYPTTPGSKAAGTG